MAVTVREQAVHVGGPTVARATVVDDGTEVLVRIWVCGGQVPSTARRRLVEQTFELPMFDRRRPLHAAVPLGDAELIVSVSRHLDDIHTRAAGATCLIDGLIVSEHSS